MSNEEVLVIEDEPQWQRELERTLRAGGYLVRIASTYSEAIVALKEGTAKVAVVDMSLIPGDAHDRQGQEIAEVARVPVVYVSGYLKEDELEKLKDEDIIDWYFRKKTFSKRKEKFMEAVADALLKRKEQIHAQWMAIERNLRPGG